MLYCEIKLFILTAAGLFLTALIPSQAPLSFLKLPFGLFFYVFLIGYILLKTALKLNMEIVFFMSVPAGLGIQGFFILILYNIVAPYFLDSANFGFCILFFNTCFLALILILKFVEDNYCANLEKVNFSLIKQFLSKPIIFVFLLGLVIRLFYLTFSNSSLMSDAALYCDLAKHLVAQGRFTSNVLNDGSTSPYQLQYGLGSYPFTWFLISLFFWLGEPSLLFAKLYSLFVGLSLVLVTYFFTKSFFGGSTALISSLIIATHPLMNFYSVVLYGPEITSLFFAVVSLFFLSDMQINKEIKRAILAGFFVAIAILSWRWEMSFIYMASFIMFLIYNRSLDKAFLWLLFTFLSFVILGFTVFFYPVLLTLIAGIAFVYFRLRKKRKNGFAFCTLAFFAVIGIIVQLALNRSYMLPELVIQASNIQGAVETRIQSLLFPNLQIFPTMFVQYYNYLSEFAPFVLLIFAILSIAFISDLKSTILLGAFIVISSIAATFLLPPNILTNTGFAVSRLFLAPIWFLSILAAVFIKNFIYAFCWTKRNINVSNVSLNLDKINLKHIKLKVLGIASVLIVILPSFYYGFVNGINIGMKEACFFQYESVDESVSWISLNTDFEDVILSFDPRLVAWFSNRTSAGLLIKNGTIWTTDIEIVDLLYLFEQFKAKFLFLPPTTLSVTSSDFLRKLYLDSPSVLYLKAFSKELLINSSIQSVSLPALLCVFKSNSTPHSIIYRHEDYQLSTRFLWQDDEFDRGWGTHRGSSSIDDGTISLITNESEDWGMFISYAFLNETLRVDNSTNVAINVAEISEKSTAGIYILFSDGTEYYEFFSEPEFYLINLSRFEGKSITQVYLYNLLAPKKTVGSSNVKYDFIAFIKVLTS